MTIPEIGQNIIVRKANGLMPLHYKHSIQTVTSVAKDASCFAEGSTNLFDVATAVMFKPDGDHIYYTSEWDIVPAIGDKVRAVGHVLGDYQGHECVITAVTVSDTAYSLRGEFKSIQKPDDTLSLDFSWWEPVDAEPVRPSQETPLIGEMRDEITALKAKITELEADNSRMSSRINSYCEDIATIGTHLMEEAERRGWCSEYDDFVQSVNGALTIAVLPEREQDFEIVVRGTATVSWSRTVTVTAKSDDEAISMVEEDPSAYMDLDEEASESASYNGWDNNEVDEVNTY